MGVKTIICSKVEYVDFRLVQSVENNTVVFKNAESDFSVLNSENAILTQKRNKSDAGAIVNQQLSLFAEMGLEVAKIFERIPLILRLTTDKGNIFIWGDLKLKVKCETLSREFDDTNLVLYRNTTAIEF